MTITIVTTTAALLTALSGAQGGDSIRLAAGSYSAIAISNLHFANDVTISSQDPGNAAVISGLNVKACSGLTFTGLELIVTGPTSANAVTVSSSQDIHFDRVYVHGVLDNNASADGGGIVLRDSSDVSVSNSEFEQLFWGIGHLNVTHMELRGNTFHDLRLDGIRGGGSSWVMIAGNYFHDFHSLAGDHGDAIQFWTTNTTASAHDILVEDNLFERGEGTVAQGVFIRDELDIYPYENVVIRGNLIIGGMFNGIAVDGARGLVIENNIVEGFLDMKSWIRVDAADGVTLTNNTANTYLIANTVTHLTNAGSQTTPLLADRGVTLTAPWIAQHQTPPPPPPPVGLNLTGTDGNDTLNGGDLGDTLAGGAGIDLLTGGAGDDLYISDKPKIVELADGGTDTVRTGGSYTLPTNVENLELIGAKATIGQGNGLDNEITGNGANNKLLGRGGDDTLDGGDGADTLTGGTGADDLTGGAGADVFTFAVGDGKDIVRDFGAGGEHDAIDVSAFLKAGQLATLTDSVEGVTISFSKTDQIFLPGVYAADLHATATGWVI